jgi:hypothetical protein
MVRASGRASYDSSSCSSDERLGMSGQAAPVPSQNAIRAGSNRVGDSVVMQRRGGVEKQRRRAGPDRRCEGIGCMQEPTGQN